MQTLLVNSCDLLSKRIFDILKTSLYGVRFESPQLWFAFKAYLWHIENIVRSIFTALSLVVICFQSVSLTYWKHLWLLLRCLPDSCDLLSKRIFDILKTSIPVNDVGTYKLWFAFKAYLWHIENITEGRKFTPPALWFAFKAYLWHIENIRVAMPLAPYSLWFAFKAYLWHIENIGTERQAVNPLVVICFQSVSLTYWKHQWGTE